MNKTELVSAVAASTGLQKVQVEKAIDGINREISNALRRGDDVKLVGFGSYVIQHRDQRKGRNPRTGEEVTIAASKAVKFKASKDLSEAVNRR